MIILYIILYIISVFIFYGVWMKLFKDTISSDDIKFLRGVSFLWPISLAVMIIIWVADFFAWFFEKGIGKVFDLVERVFNI